MPAIVITIVKLPAFWAALLAFAHALLVYFFPDFPESIWLSFDLLIGVVASAITGQQIWAGQRVQALATRSLDAKDRAGEAMYHAWAQSQQWELPDGNEIVKWAALPDHVRHAWGVAAAADVDERSGAQ